MNESENRVIDIKDTNVTSMNGEKKQKHKKKKTPIWGPFIKFYTRFRIPWWLFIISAVGQILATELNLQVAQYTINIQKGELYNNNILLYAAITLGMSILSILVNMASEYGSGILTLRGRKKIWSKILYLPANAFDNEQPSTFVSRITADIPVASSTITYLGLFVSSFYGFVRAFAILFNYNWEITLWLLLVVPIGVLDFWFIGKTQFWAYKRVYSAINKMMSFFSEHLASVKHIKAQGTEEEELAAGYEAIEKRFKADCFNAFMASVQTTVHYIYGRIAFLILVLTGKRMVESGRLERTALVTADTYMSNVQQHEASILSEYTTIKGNQAVLGRVAKLSITPTEQDILKRLTSVPEKQQDIVLDHVSFGYTPDVEILHDISLIIPKGKRTAIIGNNGCGKSTLFKLLMRFYQPSSGEIRYGIEKAEDIHLDEWRRRFGYVLQNSQLFAGSIRDNIIYGIDRDVTDEEINEAVRAANAYDFIMEFPEGLDKYVGEGGSYLSGGQRQRIAIARAIITNPDIMLMDEATASLDHVSDMLVWQAMNRVMEGRTTVLIAHDMGAVLTADNIVVMNSGRIEAVGTHDELIKTSPTYRDYVELQQRAEVK